MIVDEELRVIAPKWYDRITNARSYRELLTVKDQLDLSQYGSCVIGEAHGFDGNYSTRDQKKNKELLSGCPRCTSYAKIIYDKHPDKNSGIKFKSAISRFLIHVRTDHGMKL